MRLAEELRELDWHILLLVFVLVVLGILFIHSATQDDESEFAGQATTQAWFVLPSTAVLLFFLLVPYMSLRRWAPLFYAASLGLLLLLPFLGVSLNNARRWLSIAGIQVQPSEFMKLGLLLLLARWFEPRTRPTRWQGLIAPGLLTALPMVLILKEPDLSSALVLVPLMFGVCYAAGGRLRWILITVIAGAALFAALWALDLLHAYQVDRIRVWWEQRDMPREMRLGAGYHLHQSKIAIGQGGLWGMGYLQGLQNYFDFLPYRSTDFIFSVLAEEMGLVGGLLFLFLYGLLIVQLFGIAGRTRERFGRLLATGVALLFATQLFMHVAVCTGIMPPTGLTLPLISYGRSSLLTSFAALGLALNVGMRRVRVLTPDAY